MAQGLPHLLVFRAVWLYLGLVVYASTGEEYSGTRAMPAAGTATQTWTNMLLAWVRTACPAVVCSHVADPISVRKCT